MPAFAQIAVLAVPLLGLFVGRWSLVAVATLIPVCWVLLAQFGYVGTEGLFLSRPPQSAFHDTYYVGATTVSLASFAATFALPMIVSLALTLAGALYRARWLLGALLVSHAGAIAARYPALFLSPQGIPQRYIDYPEAFALWNKIAFYGAAVSLSGFTACLLLALWAIATRLSFGAIR